METAAPGPLGATATDNTIEFQWDENLQSMKLRGGGFNFSQQLFVNSVQLVQDPNSKKYNFGPLLIAKMREIQKEGQVYYWPERRSAPPEQEALRKTYAAKSRQMFVRFGDFSDLTQLHKKSKTAGSFDQLYKAPGTTNCSTAVLDALYRALGGRINSRGRIVSVGGVNGVPLSDARFSGFPKLFQGPGWDDAIVSYKLGYKVPLDQLQPGDIISKPGHRMVVLQVLGTTPKGMTRIRTLEAKYPTGSTVTSAERTVRPGWQAARIFDLAE